MLSISLKKNTSRNANKNWRKVSPYSYTAKINKDSKSDNLASDSKDKKQLNKACRETTSNKKKREANKCKNRKKQFLNAHLFRRNIETFSKSNEGQIFYKKPVQNIRNLLFLRKRSTLPMWLSHSKNGNFLILLTRGTGKSQKKLKTFQYGED